MRNVILALAFILGLGTCAINASAILAASTKLSALPSATLTDGDEGYTNDGGTSAKFTMAELRTLIVGKGFINLDLFSAREVTANEIPNQATLAGGVLGADTVPILERVSGATDKGARITWAISAANDEIQFAPVAMPMDLDETVDVTIHIVAEMGGATDTSNTFDVQVFDGVGDTEMGGVTASITDALLELTITIANANITGGPLGFFNISIIPTGTHTADAIYIYVAWIEYTRKAPL